jgi:Recombination endonuclease VII
VAFRDPETAKAYAKAYRKANKERQAEYAKAYYKANKDKMNAQSRCGNQRRNYGITMIERDQLLSEQGGVCACCGTSSPGGHGWHTDHIHGTKIIRGILCTKCNTGIGLLGDTSSGVQNALNYLSKSEPTLFPGIWKRIDPKTSSLNSRLSDQEKQKECSNNRSSSEMASDVDTVALKSS